MNPWNQHTLFRFLIGLIAGIGIYQYYGNFLPAVWVMLTVLLLMLLAIRYIIVKHSLYHLRYMPGIIMVMMMILMGYEYNYVYDLRNSKYHLGNYYTGSEPVIAMITRPIEERPKSFRALVSIQAINIDGEWQNATGKAFVSFPKDTLIRNLQYGDLLVFYSRFSPPSHPANPGEFNFNRYLLRKNIHFVSYARPGDWARLSRNNGNVVMDAAFNLRHFIIKRFAELGVTGKEYSVALALIIGFDDFLDQETKEEFSGSGAMHVLCVSGLHVGIIYLVINGMLFFLNRNRRTRWLKALLIMAALWGYAMITGLSPSVLRATAMFSFILIGNSLNREASVYNSLASSAFVLLLFNPGLIGEIGFQLSYAAVIAIVSIYPFLYRQWQPNNWLADKAWSLVVLSVAAQAGTFPLSLFYFHQFPNYFLLTNLLVVPLAAVILYSGLLTLLLSFIPLLGYLLSEALVFFLKILTNSVSAIESLPYAVSQNIYLPALAVVLIYLSLIFFFRAILLRSKTLILSGLSCVTVLMAAGTFEKWRVGNQANITIYSVRNTTVADFFWGNKAVAFVPASHLDSVGRFDYHVKENRIRSGIKSIITLPFDSVAEIPIPLEVPLVYSPPVIQFAGKDVLFFDGGFPASALGDTLWFDKVIVTSGIVVPDVAMEKIRAEKIILSSALPAAVIRKWEDECSERGLKCYPVGKSGAFISKIY